jgi:hypothetical protein
VTGRYRWRSRGAPEPGLVRHRDRGSTPPLAFSQRPAEVGGGAGMGSGPLTYMSQGKHEEQGLDTPTSA